MSAIASVAYCNGIVSVFGDWCAAEKIVPSELHVFIKLNEKLLIKLNC